MNQLTDIFKILSDETRLRIILLLSQEELCVCELCGILEVPQPNVSRNLAILRDRNLVIDVKKEKFVFYKQKKENGLLNKILKIVKESISEDNKYQKDLARLTTKEKCVNRNAIAAENFGMYV